MYNLAYIYHRFKWVYLVNGFKANQHKNYFNVS